MNVEPWAPRTPALASVSEFTVEYDESVAFFGSDQECIAVLGTLRFNEDRGGQIDVDVEPLEGVPWQYWD